MAKIHKLDQEALRQQELVYTAEFQIQLMERKVARASGERSDEEKKQLQGRIGELTVELETAVATEKMLLNQTKRLKDELKRVQRKQVRHLLRSCACMCCWGASTVDVAWERWVLSW